MEIAALRPSTLRRRPASSHHARPHALRSSPRIHCVQRSPCPTPPLPSNPPRTALHPDPPSPTHSQSRSCAAPTVISHATPRPAHPKQPRGTLLPVAVSIPLASSPACHRPIVPWIANDVSCRSRARTYTPSSRPSYGISISLLAECTQPARRQPLRLSQFRFSRQLRIAVRALTRTPYSTLV